MPNDATSDPIDNPIWVTWNKIRDSLSQKAAKTATATSPETSEIQMNVDEILRMCTLKDREVTPETEKVKVNMPPVIEEPAKPKESIRFVNPNFIKIEMARSIRGEEGFALVTNIALDDQLLYEQLIMDHPELILEIRRVAHDINDKVVPNMLSVWTFKGKESDALNQICELVEDVHEDETPLCNSKT